MHKALESATTDPMSLLDETTAEYYRQHPLRKGRSMPVPDWLPAFMAVVERKLSRKIDRLLPVADKAEHDG